MKIDEFTSPSVNTCGGGENPPCVGLASSVLPETRSAVAIESSQTGVSTSNHQLLLVDISIGKHR